jgi:hypothetical protein
MAAYVVWQAMVLSTSSSFAADDNVADNKPQLLQGKSVSVVSVRIANADNDRFISVVRQNIANAGISDAKLGTYQQIQKYLESHTAEILEKSRLLAPASGQLYLKADVTLSLGNWYSARKERLVSRDAKTSKEVDTELSRGVWVNSVVVIGQDANTANAEFTISCAWAQFGGYSQDNCTRGSLNMFVGHLLKELAIRGADQGMIVSILCKEDLLPKNPYCSYDGTTWVDRGVGGGLLPQPGNLWEVLGEIKDQTAISVLKSTVADSSSPQIFRLAAGRVLSKLKIRKEDAPVAVDFLIAEKKWDDVIRLGAAAVEPLVTGLEVSQSDAERKEIQDALEKIGRPAAPLLIKCLKGSRWLLRESAAQVLGTIGGRDVIYALIPLLDDEVYWVRQAAAVGMTRLAKAEKTLSVTDPNLCETLARAAVSHHVESEAAAAEVLAKAGYFPLRYLIAALNSSQFEDWQKKEMATLLKKLTGVDMGTDYKRWMSWWENIKRESQQQERRTKGWSFNAIFCAARPARLNTILRSATYNTALQRTRDSRAAERGRQVAPRG